MVMDAYGLEEHSRLVRKYLDEHYSELGGKSGAARWLERIRLEVRAWKYAHAELEKQGHDPKKPTLNG